MEVAEPPECPVCLQSYDVVSAIPRVLTCGHTTCEACLKQLPCPFPNTLRCTVCTLLVKIPNSVSALPKNLDLLHFSSILQLGRPAKDEKVNSPLSQPENGKIRSALFPSYSKSWSYEFFCKWKRWVIPKECISTDKIVQDKGGAVVNGEILKSFESDHVMGFVPREKENVGLVKVGIFVKDEEDSMIFRPSYESRIVTILYGMKEDDRHKLRIMLNAAHKMSHVGKAYGFWLDENDNCLYMVWQRFTSSKLTKFVLMEKDVEEERMSRDAISSLGILCMEMCEIMSRLHSEGLIIGCLSVSSIGFDDFGHVCIDLSEVLNSGMRVHTAVTRARKDLQVNFNCNSLDDNVTLISPEMLLLFIDKEGSEFVFGKSQYEVGYASDVWSIASLLVWLVVGNSFSEEIETLMQSAFNAIKDEKRCDYGSLYISWVEKIAVLLKHRLGFYCNSVCEVLCRCLEFDPRNRPVVTELWKFLRELIVKPQFDISPGLRQEVKKEHTGNCILLGDICDIVKEIDKDLKHSMKGKDENDAADVELRMGRDIVEGWLPNGRFKCTEVRGHTDCVTGLAIGGGFLFSSSYDKIVHVWSLQDFTLLQSFKGHEHRVMAVVFIGGEQPLCISGDNEGVVCIWKADFPFSEMPMAKLYEKKDWRFSGIHAMAVSGTEYLYTGSGDKLVKAWSLQDYTLSCEMSGHKSVVSSLTVWNGVLFSGSWDGTVRLWSLTDHSPLAVLGEGKFGNLVSVLSLSADRDLLFAGHENGLIKIWRNDVLLGSTHAHKGAIFSIGKNGKWLFSGGWDKTINVQEISEAVDEVDVTPVGSIPCSSTITSLVYCNGKLFVAQADRIIKVYYHGVY